MKVKPYSRQMLHDVRLDWIRRNRRMVVSLTIGLLLVLAVVTALVVGLGDAGAVNWYVLGVVHAASVGGYLAMLNAVVLASDVTAIRHLRGAWGEENTRSELSAAKRRRVIWGWVDSISLRGGDLDHVVVTRNGGVVVIDSKWRNHAGTDDVANMAASAEKVRRRAEALTTQVLRTERGAHRASGRAVRVTPVVVLWGPEQSRLTDGSAQVHGIDFVAGSHLRSWLRGLDGDPVAKGAAAELVRRLREFRAGVSSSHAQVRA
jgi:nuclease-like protein